MYISSNVKLVKVKKGNLAIGIILFILIVDQVFKIWIKTTMVLGQEIHIADWFIIHFTENNGMAFGFEFGDKWGKYVLSIFRIVAVVAIAFYMRTMIQKKAPTGVIIGFALIFAGAVGNILDSVYYGIIFGDSLYHVAEFMPEGGGYSSFLQGRVVDMLYFPILKTTYPTWFPINAGQPFIFFRPVFNIADSAITGGILLMLVFYRDFFKKAL